MPLCYTYAFVLLTAFAFCLFFKVLAIFHPQHKLWSQIFGKFGRRRRLTKRKIQNMRHKHTEPHEKKKSGTANIRWNCHASFHKWPCASECALWLYYMKVSWHDGCIKSVCTLHGFYLFVVFAHIFFFFSIRYFFVCRKSTSFTELTTNIDLKMCKMGRR